MATNADNGTYMYIPPPPLPEFYMPNISGDSAISLTASKKNGLGAQRSPLITMDGAYDGQPTFIPPPPPLMAIPSTSQKVPGYDVPPLAIYHICRLCLRTRSARYHREHPIPIDGIPLPPGICRRCRVASIEKLQKITNVIVEGQSNKIKLGFIAPFVPDEAIISNNEFRQMKVDDFIGRLEKDGEKNFKLEHRRGNRIQYRHIDPVDVSRPSAPTRTSRVTFNDEGSDRGTSDEQDTSRLCSRQLAKSKVNSIQAQSTGHVPTVSTRKPQSKFYKVSNGQISSKASSTSVSASSSDSCINSPNTATQGRVLNSIDSAIREIVREEVQYYHGEGSCAKQRSTDIRTIARDEIERYRKAERILEAHPDGYAHGRMVPVERRFERKQDTIGNKLGREHDPRAQASMTSSKPTVGIALRRSESPVVEHDSNVEESRKIQARGTGSSTRQSRREPSPNRHESHSGSGSTQNNERLRSQSQPSNIMRETTFGKVRTKASDGREQKSKAEAEAPKQHMGSYLARNRNQNEEHMKNNGEAGEERKNFSSNSVASVRDQIVICKEWPESLPSHDPMASLWQSGARDGVQIPHERTVSGASQYHSIRGNSADCDEWEGLSRVRTLESQSSQFYETSGSGGTPRESARECNRQSDHSPRPRTRSFRSESRTNFPTDETVWPESGTIPSRSSHPISQRARSPASRQPRSSNISKAHAPDATEERSERSRQSGSRPRCTDPLEKPRAESVASPFDPLNDLPHFQGFPRPRRVEVEEWIEAERYPGPDRGASRKRVDDDRERMQRRVHEIRKQSMSHAPASIEKEASKDCSKDFIKVPTEHRRRREDWNGATNDFSHVRFSNKVDYSPTPPDSDDSSSAFRSYHSISRRTARGDTDGASSPAARRTEAVGESDTRGRTASRASDRRKVRSPGQDAFQHGSDTKNGADVDDRATLQGQRPLQRALSESPSRERSISSLNRNDEQDGRGPYRKLEKPSDSMQVEDGRRGGGAESVNTW